MDNTPGQWTVPPAAPYSVWCGDTQIASCRWYDYDYPYEGTFDEHCADGAAAHANALLISAAPDLLTALKAMIGAWETGGKYERNEIGMARAAIAKAEGLCTARQG